MVITLNIPDYDSASGLQNHWETDFEIKVNIQNNQVLISANKAGLISLATQLLTLAQDNVPSGMHLHLDKFNSLEEESQELIIQKG